MALPALRVLRDEEAEYYAAGPKRRRVDVWIKGGFIDAKHCDAFPSPLMLYLYLLQNADFETGILPDYRHEQAMAQLRRPRRTIERWYAHLKECGYITDISHRTTLEVHVTRYLPQSQRKRDKRSRSAPPDVAVQGSPDVAEVANPAPPDLTPSPARSGVSLLDPYTNYVQTNEGVCADAPRAVKKRQRIPDTQPLIDAFYQARKVDRAKVPETVVKALVERAAEIAGHYTPEDVAGCVAYVLTDRWHYDKGLPALFTTVNATLPTWVADGRPDKQRGRDNGHRAETPVRASRTYDEVWAELTAPPEARS